jgi:hypothetical protein
VSHAAKPSVGLTKDGVFALRHVRTVDLAFFQVPGAVEYVEDLEPSTFAQVLEMWEAG